MFMRTTIRLLSLAGLLWLAASAPTAFGQDAKDKKKKQEMNVDFTVGWGGCYRPLEWTPVTVEITTPFEKPVDCTVRLSAAQDDLNVMDISRREVLMHGLPKQIPLVARLSYPPGSARLTITGTDSPLYWSRTYELWDQFRDTRMLTEVQHWEALIGVTGSQGASIMQVPQVSVPRRESRRGGGRGNVHARYRFQRLLPADWTGYASLDLLVLYDPEWVELTDHQQRAIIQYVHNGGSVLMVLGGKPLPASSLLARMLPLALGDPREIRLARGDLSNWNCPQPKTDKVSCWRAATDPNAHGWAFDADSNGNAVFVSGPVGFGKAGVLLFDPAQLGCRPDRELAKFWVPRMAPLVSQRGIVLNDHADSIHSNRYDYEPGPESQASNSVLDHLYAIEQLKPIHIGWVVLVLAGLAVLIGPVDYLVLKAAGRLTWTWVTSTACIGVFSIGAYYGVEYLRGGELQAKLVSVIDAVDGADGAWATRYLGIFAPHSDDYRLAGVDRRQWWAGIAPIREQDFYRYRESSASRTIYCQQHIDGGSVPVSVPINIWSMQSLICQSHLAKAPFSATARLAPGGQWTITITNPGPAAITRSYARVGKGSAVVCGSIPAGKTEEFIGGASSWRPRGDRYPAEAEALGAGTGLLNAASFAQGSANRSAAIDSYLEAGAVVVCAEYDDSPVPFDIEGKRCRFQHNLLARLVVFPEGR